MKEESTPTYKSVGKHLEALAAAIDKELEEQHYRPLSFARLNDIAETICMIFDDEEEKPRILGDFCQGLIDLQMAAVESPEVANVIAAGAQKILIAMCNVAIVVAHDRMRVEVARIAPLARRNQASGNLITLARVLAKRFWALDAGNEIRTGDMAEKVYRKLADEGLIKLLPGSADRVKKWIKPVAPEYATKAGRRKISRP